MMAPGSWPTAGLILASLAGIGFAMGPAVTVEASPRGGAAVVNGAVIEQAEYDRALAAVMGDKRNQITDADRERVMTRLIEEELLIQRGVEIGLVDRDRAVRSALVSAVVNHVLAPSQSDPVSEADLRAWYDTHADRFRPQSQFHVRRVFPVDGPPLPEGLVPASTLRAYIGPSGLAGAMVAGPGTQFEDASGNGFELVDRLTPAPPDFDAQRDEIEAAYRRDAGDKAFRAYLDWLERRANVRRVSG